MEVVRFVKAGGKVEKVLLFWCVGGVTDSCVDVVGELEELVDGMRGNKACTASYADSRG